MHTALRLLLVLVVAGCAVVHAKQQAPQPTPTYTTYPVSAAFGPHAVQLTAAQRKWLLRVVLSRTYGSKRAHLRFALAEDSTRLIVFLADFPTNALDPAVHVIGGPCNDFFRPAEGYEFTGTDAGCYVNTPAPVLP